MADNIEWDKIDAAGSGSQDIVIPDRSTNSPFGLPGVNYNAHYCGVNLVLKWKVSKSRDLYIRIERKGNNNSIYGSEIIVAAYTNLILRATVFPGTFAENEMPGTFWKYTNGQMHYDSSGTKFGIHRGDALFFENAEVDVTTSGTNNFILADIANPPGGSVSNQQKAANGADVGIFMLHFDDAPNPEVSIAISGTGLYNNVTNAVYPKPYVTIIKGVKEVVEQILDYFPCSRYFNNTYQSCNRSGGSFQTWHNNAWQDKKNVANNSSKSTTFYYSNGWQIAPKTGANAK